MVHNLNLPCSLFYLFFFFFSLQEERIKRDLVRTKKTFQIVYPFDFLVLREALKVPFL